MKKCLVLIIFCFVAISAIAAEGTEKIELPDRGVCAHRGAMSTHPENTLPAFLEAIRLGAHMIEFDVYLTKDGELVIIHDLTLERTTNGSGKVADLTLTELKQLDAGIKHGEEFRGTKIPTLSETLAIMPVNIWLNVHLKGHGELGKKVAELIIRENRQHQAFLACGAADIKAAREVFADILICNMDRQQNSLDYVNSTIGIKADFIQLLGKGVVLPETIRLLNKNGIRINYYRADTSAILKKLFSEGIQFPLVNDVEPMLQAASEIGIKPVKPVFRGKKQ